MLFPKEGIDFEKVMQNVLIKSNTVCELLFVCYIAVCGQPLPTSWTQIRPTEYPAWSGFKLLDTLMIFLKLLFENVNFKKFCRKQKSCKITQYANI